MKQIFLFFIAWRFLLIIPLIVGYLFVSYNNDAPYTSLWNFTKPYPPVNNFLLFPWANSDGVHYLSIVGDGYALDGSNARFFPLFPIAIRSVSYIFGTGLTFGTVQFFSGLILSNLFFLLALIVFYKLIRLDYPHSIAITSTMFLLVFPTSFFFASIYSESLFLLLLLSSFYFARRGKWFTASFLGLLLCATRVVGIAILPALIYEYLWGNKRRKLRFRNIFSLGLIPLGIIAYMLFNFQKWGNALWFFLAQGQMANNRSVETLTFPLQVVFRYGKIFATVSTSQFVFWIAFLEVGAFLVALVLLFIAWKKKIRGSYLLYGVFAFLISTLSGTFNGLPRYVLVLFPMFMTLALFENKIVKVVYVAASVVILFALLMFFSRGYFIA